MRAPTCCACGAQLTPCYRDLQDDQHQTPGQWDLWHCASGCGSAALWPPPDPATLVRAYVDYHTHDASLERRQETGVEARHAAGSGDDEGRSPSRGARLWRQLQTARWHDRFGYDVNASFTGRMGVALLHLWPGRLADLDAGIFFLQAPTPTTGKRLLEFGCGDGALLGRMASLGWQTCGLDTDPVAVQRARTRGLQVSCGDLTTIDDDAPFDAIVGKHVIEHVQDPRRDLSIARTLLRDGGRLVLTTPNFGGKGHRRWRRDWRGLEAPRHLHLFTPHGLTQLLEETGFAVDELRTTGRARSAARASRAQYRRRRELMALPPWLAALLAELEEFNDAWFTGDQQGNELLICARAIA